MTSIRRTVHVLLVGTIGLLPGAAMGADTTEPFEVGFSDAEISFAFAGLGSGSSQQLLAGEVAVGAGILPRLSLRLSAVAEGNAQFSEANAAYVLDLFGAMIDTDHVDLDLGLQLGTSGTSPTRFEVRPWTELNLDVKPDLALMGLYFRVGVPVYGRDVASEPDGAAISEPAFNVETVIGAYYTVSSNHQLLVEYDFCFVPSPLDGDRSVEVGGIAFGYNVTVHKQLELISQLAVDIPQSGERTALSVMVGFVATLPTGS